MTDLPLCDACSKLVQPSSGGYIERVLPDQRRLAYHFLCWERIVLAMNGMRPEERPFTQAGVRR